MTATLQDTRRFSEAHGLLRTSAILILVQHVLHLLACPL